MNRDCPRLEIRGTANTQDQKKVVKGTCLKTWIAVKRTTRFSHRCSDWQVLSQIIMKQFTRINHQ